MSGEPSVSVSFKTLMVTSKDALLTELLAHIVYVVGGTSSVGVPRMDPSILASRAGLQPNDRPAGNSPLISHVATSPPTTVGRYAVISDPFANSSV